MFSLPKIQTDIFILISNAMVSALHFVNKFHKDITHVNNIYLRSYNKSVKMMILLELKLPINFFELGNDRDYHTRYFE